MAVAISLIMGFAAAPAHAAWWHHHARGHARAQPRGRVVYRAAGAATDPVKDAALVVDAATGRPLYSRNADAPRHPASLTKMMTLYLLFDALKKGQVTMATPLPVSAHAAAQKPTKLALRPGDTIPVDLAIRAIVIRSANDVAVTIAEALGGTESHFAVLMTAKAREIGMTNTYYHNASGLPDPLQISTATDLALLARHLGTDFPQYYHYFGLPGFTYRGVTYPTHDNLIGRYQGADGIKTGYTGASGFNLVSSVVRGNTHIIGVVMGGITARRRDTEMMALLDNTFYRIGQNPSLVASARVPYQTAAPSTVVATAGFDMTPPSVRPASTPNLSTIISNMDDEDAAETRPDNTADAGNMVAPPPAPTPTVAATPPPRPQQQQQPVTLTPPPPAMTVSLKHIPIPTPAPPRNFAVAEADAPLPVLAHVPLPKPKPAMQVASLTRPAQRLSMRQEIGEGDISDDPVAPKLNAGDWTVQIGAYNDKSLAQSRLASYAQQSTDVLGQAARIVIPFRSADGQTMYRARFGPFPERQARDVCARMTQRGQTCFAAVATR